MSKEIDPTEETAPEPIDVRVMRDGVWVHVGQATYLEDGSMSIKMDEDEEKEGAKIIRHLNSGYINSYSIYTGEKSDGSEPHA